MPPTLPAPRITALTDLLCGLIARHGHLRRIAGPLLVLIWQRVRIAAAQTGALLARMQAGQLKRYPARRAPRPSAAPRRRPARSALPRGHAWLVTLIPETAASAVHLQTVLADENMPALLEAAPQLRRRLSPLCRMLGVKLPPRPQPPPLLPPASRRPRRAAPRAPSFPPHAPSPKPPSLAAVWPAKLASGPPQCHSPP